MSDQGRGSLPPEVPDEFAAAYREAYEQAMAAQSVPQPQSGHADRGVDEAGLPRRTRRVAIGTHRQLRGIEPEPEAELEPYDARPTAFERITDSGWLVPVLLGVLLLLLVAGAYVLGRAFSSRVSDGGSDGAQPRIVMSEVLQISAAT